MSPELEECTLVRVLGSSGAGNATLVWNARWVRVHEIRSDQTSSAIHSIERIGLLRFECRLAALSHSCASGGKMTTANPPISAWTISTGEPMTAPHSTESKASSNGLNGSSATRQIQRRNNREMVSLWGLFFCGDVPRQCRPALCYGSDERSVSHSVFKSSR